MQTAVERAEWVKAMQPVYEKFSTTVGQDFIDKIAATQK